MDLRKLKGMVEDKFKSIFKYHQDDLLNRYGNDVESSVLQYAKSEGYCVETTDDLVNLNYAVLFTEPSDLDILVEAHINYHDIEYKNDETLERLLNDVETYYQVLDNQTEHIALGVLIHDDVNDYNNHHFTTHYIKQKMEETFDEFELIQYIESHNPSFNERYYESLAIQSDSDGLDDIDAIYQIINIRLIKTFDDMADEKRPLFNQSYTLDDYLKRDFHKELASRDDMIHYDIEIINFN